MADRAALSTPSAVVLRAMEDAGFEVMKFRYDPDASEDDRRAVVRDMYAAMHRVRQANSADLG